MSDGSRKQNIDRAAMMSAFPTALPSRSSPMPTGNSMTRVNPALSMANWFIEIGISPRIAVKQPSAASASP